MNSPLTTPGMTVMFVAFAVRFLSNCSILTRARQLLVAPILPALLAGILLACSYPDHAASRKRSLQEFCPDWAASPKRSLEERLNAALDPEYGTLSGRLEHKKDVYDEDLCGTIIEPPSQGPIQFSGKLDRYEDFKSDMDIVFMLQLDSSTQAKFGNWFGRQFPPLECELVPYAREHIENGVLTPVFPGWREEGCWSVQFNGVPFWSGTIDGAQQKWRQLHAGSRVCVRGAIVLDRKPNKYEIHPIYSIRLLAE